MLTTGQNQFGRIVELVVPIEIKQILEKQFDVMIEQTKSYLPFIKLAFPKFTNLSDLCFTLIVGNVLPVFISQYAIRMKPLDRKDFVEFGQFSEKYRTKIRKILK